MDQVPSPRVIAEGTFRFTRRTQMNADLNHATRRMLQIVIDLLSNPTPKDPDEKYWVPYRNDMQFVEGAVRAAQSAQQMLAEAMPAQEPSPKVAP